VAQLSKKKVSGAYLNINDAKKAMNTAGSSSNRQMICEMTKKGAKGDPHQVGGKQQGGGKGYGFNKWWQGWADIRSMNRMCEGNTNCKKKVKFSAGYQFSGSYAHVNNKGGCADTKGWHKRCHCSQPLSWCKKQCTKDKNCKGYVQSWSPTNCQIATTAKCPKSSGCSQYDQGTSKISTSRRVGSGYGGCFYKAR